MSTYILDGRKLSNSRHLCTWLYDPSYNSSVLLVLHRVWISTLEMRGNRLIRDVYNTIKAVNVHRVAPIYINRDRPGYVIRTCQSAWRAGLCQVYHQLPLYPSSDMYTKLKFEIWIWSPHGCTKLTLIDCAFQCTPPADSQKDIPGPALYDVISSMCTCVHVLIRPHSYF